MVGDSENSLLLPRGDGKGGETSDKSHGSDGQNNDDVNDNHNHNHNKQDNVNCNKAYKSMLSSRPLQKLSHQRLRQQPAWTRSIYARENLSLPTSYFLVGFSTALLATPISVYMIKEIGAQPEEQNTVAILMTVPWSFKLVYGFLSDSVPLFGYRRKVRY